ncbi:MAG: PilC/PilY family type IV pilus protein, partial [Gammaproteobacteria bacterium]|nr:PilC/PilY family type IV pilus protein [Gammaproteobacteria bacterium]
DGQLDGYATDKVVKFFYDSSQNRTRIARYDTTDGITLTLNSVGEIEGLKTLWDAKRELNEMSSGALTTNRTFADANNLDIESNSKRYIFTWLDDNKDGVVDSGEQYAFLDSSFTSSNYGYFKLQTDKDGDSDIDADDAKRLVNFIRGVDYSTLRNRTIDYDNDGTDEVWRLGDIIHSSPVIVEKPSAIWRTQYGDTTYNDFANQYAKRRSIVYVGGNDGLLHAFNSGFLDTSIKKYDLTRAAVAPHESSDPASHKLGAEIWAYAPKNLLPHLQWLSEPNYPNHVYYVDGELKTFDVNIFTADTDHPNGWGTILVATMRFGGGSDDTTNPTSLDIDVDGDSTADFKARSSIIILDITNPEKPPVLLAEYNDTNLGLTLSTPELMVFRQPALLDGNWANPSVNDWYLVFGSGPTDLNTLLSTQTPSLYTMKLNDIDTGTINVSKKTLSTTNSYIGRPHTVDWSNNFVTDTVYFGVAGGTVASPTGYLARMRSAELEENATFYDIASNWSISTVINPAQPFVFKPTTLRTSGKHWVYAGSGRRLITGDDSFTPVQSYYGIKENISTVNGLPDTTTFTRGASGTTLLTSELQNVTGIQVFANSSIIDTASNLPSTMTTFAQLESYINGQSGWYRDWQTVSSLNERVNADTQTLT